MFPGLGPVAFHAMFPVFVTVTCTVLLSPKYAAAVACAPKTAAKVTGATNDGWRNGGLPSCPNQATPSRTRSIVRMHAHDTAGATTVALTVAEPCGSTIAGRGGRPPAHTIVLPGAPCPE